MFRVIRREALRQILIGRKYRRTHVNVIDLFDAYSHPLTKASVTDCPSGLRRHEVKTPVFSH